MSLYIGRKLKKHEVVHHINGDKTDNRIENLQLLPNRRVHNQLHASKNCPQGHEYTKENTLYKKNSNGKKYRRCRECHRLTGNIKNNTSLRKNK